MYGLKKLLYIYTINNQKPLKMGTKTEIELVEKLDNVVSSVIGSEKLIGFKDAFTKASAIQQLKNLLSPEYMEPIMALQGCRLGFKTDKDIMKQQGGGYTKGPGYPVEVVKNCLIEAVLMGLQPTGNHFNIIAGNTYITKEGCGYLLNKLHAGIKWTVVCRITRVSQDKTSAEVEATVTWGNNTQILPIPIKTDAYTSLDAIIGKATRKARAWLLSTLSGYEIPEGDIDDQAAIVVQSTSVLDELKELFNEKQMQLTDADRVRIQDIIDHADSNNYRKAINFLKDAKG